MLNPENHPHDGTFARNKHILRANTSPCHTIQHVALPDNRSGTQLTVRCMHPNCAQNAATDVGYSHSVVLPDPVVQGSLFLQNVSVEGPERHWTSIRNANADHIAVGLVNYLNEYSVHPPNCLDGQRVDEPLIINPHTCLPHTHTHIPCPPHTAYHTRLLPYIPPEQLDPVLPLRPDPAALLAVQPPSIVDLCAAPSTSCTSFDCVHPVETARVGGGHPALLGGGSIPATSLEDIRAAQAHGLPTPFAPDWSALLGCDEATALQLEEQLHTAREAPSLVHAPEVLARAQAALSRRGLSRGTCCERVMIDATGIYAGPQLLFAPSMTPTQWWPAMCSSIWSRVTQWDFDMFELDRVSLHRPLTALLFYIAHREGWFTRFPITPRKLAALAAVLEVGYLDNAYHNRVHAADVVHGVYSMCVLGRKERLANPHARPVTASTSSLKCCTPDQFCASAYGCEHVWAPYTDTDWAHGLPESFRASVNDAHARIRECGIALPQGAAAVQSSENPSDAAPADASTVGTTGRVHLSQLVDDVDVLCMVLAAAMHDYKHPGCTNAHLLVSKDGVAARLRGYAVLEQWHATEALSLLSFPAVDLLSGFEEDVAVRIRDCIAVLIAGTDMQQHGYIHTNVKDMVSRGVLSPALGEHVVLTRADKLALMRSVVHLADIANPCKPLPLCTQWAERVWEEWHLQREREATVVGCGCHALVVMREFNSLPASQFGFLSFVALPYAQTMAALLRLPWLVTIAETNLAYWRSVMRPLAPQLQAISRAMDARYLARVCMHSEAASEKARVLTAERDGLSYSMEFQCGNNPALVLENGDEEMLAALDPDILRNVQNAIADKQREASEELAKLGAPAAQVQPNPNPRQVNEEKST